MFRAPSLRTVLVATTVALVGLAVLVVGLQAVRLLGRLAQNQALARVDLAGLSAVEAMEQAAAVPGGFEVVDVHEISRRVGLPVEIIDLERALSGAGHRRAVLWGRAASEGVGGSARVDELGAFVSVQPIRDHAGAVVALVETRLDTAAVDASVRQLTGLLLASTLAVGGVAAIVALVIGRALVRPLEALTEASARIGRGDLSSPVPRAGRAETQQLASSMEEMRVRLLQLTAELARRRAQAEAVITGIVEGVWAVDGERRMTWLNPQAAAMLGVRSEDAIGRFCGDVLHPLLPRGERPCEEHCPILDARFRGSARATERLKLVGGHERNVVITSAPPTETEEGGQVAFQQFQVLRDETEIEAARGLRDAVLANVSHEFRTPLSAQLASLEMLRDRLGQTPASELVGLVNSAERATLKLTRLVDNLLESLRIEAGREAIRRQDVQIDQVVEEASELMGPLIQQKSQALDVRLPWPLPGIVGDGPRLVQVFVNLLANANKFAPAGSSIRMGGEVTEREIAVWVEDEGPGLPEELDERLFERFLRAAGEEPEQSGMGLGLWIVNSIVTRHGGRVDARNTGSGARITVVLPRSQAPADDDEDPGRRR